MTYLNDLTFLHVWVKKPHIFHVNMQECGLLYAIVDPVGVGGGVCWSTYLANE